jgi:hypothetical protein
LKIKILTQDMGIVDDPMRAMFDAKTDGTWRRKNGTDARNKATCVQSPSIQEVHPITNELPLGTNSELTSQEKTFALAHRIPVTVAAINRVIVPEERSRHITLAKERMWADSKKFSNKISNTKVLFGKPPLSSKYLPSQRVFYKIVSSHYQS